MSFVHAATNSLAISCDSFCCNRGNAPKLRKDIVHAQPEVDTGNAGADTGVPWLHDTYVIPCRHDIALTVSTACESLNVRLGRSS